MARIINLCPHSFDVYEEADFINLEVVNPTTIIADGIVEGAVPIISLPSEGSARIGTSTMDNGTVLGVPAVKTTYGDLTIAGLDKQPLSFSEDDILVVSLPCQSMSLAAGHPAAKQMASPYRVVRLRSDTSKVLGAQGYSFQ